MRMCNCRRIQIQTDQILFLFFLLVLLVFFYIVYIFPYVRHECGLYVEVLVDASSMFLSSGDAFPLRNVTFLIVFVLVAIHLLLLLVKSCMPALLLNLLLLQFLLLSSTSELTSTVARYLSQTLSTIWTRSPQSNRWGSSLGFELMIYRIEFSSSLENKGMFGSNFLFFFFGC